MSRLHHGTLLQSGIFNRCFRGTQATLQGDLKSTAQIFIQNVKGLAIISLNPGSQCSRVHNRHTGRGFGQKDETNMRIFDSNWMQVEKYLEHDDRIVLPVGSTEQHGFLSLGTDAILAERVSVEAAAPLGVPVLPVLPFGMAPYFASYPGSMSLRFSTYIEVVRDLLDCLEHQGFRRIAMINGHGGNSPVAGLIREWTCQPRNEVVQVLFHSWYSGPKTIVAANEFDHDQMHGSWVENFAWTRLADIEMPAPKPIVPRELVMNLGPDAIREAAPDGSLGGAYEYPDEAMQKVWAAGVTEVREVIESGWVK
jgi:creatinine amidohydrolase